MLKQTIFASLLAALTCGAAYSQYGGGYSIMSSTVAGGSTKMSGGAFSVDVTVGQPMEGTSASGGTYGMAPGLPPTSQAPTSSGVSISGRVLTANGRGITSAKVTLLGGTGPAHVIFTGRNGIFIFNNIEAGMTYILSASSRRFIFVSRTLEVTDNVSGVDLIAQTP